jgi:hypothetical protein
LSAAPWRRFVPVAATKRGNVDEFWSGRGAGVSREATEDGVGALFEAL